MKTWLIAVVSLLIGSLIGCSLTWREMASVENDFLTQVELKDVKRTNKTKEILTPKVEVIGGEKFQFGTMESNTVRKHTFQLKNVGTAPLTLKMGDTTCKCTLSNLSKGYLNPGEISEVVLTWTPKSLAPKFRQSAVIHTNDVHNLDLRLFIEGVVTYAVKTVPKDLVFSDISTNEATFGKFRMYCFREKQMKLVEYKLSEVESAGFFHVEARALTQEELTAESGALSGLEFTVQVKPGLPLGSVKQTIEIVTNVEGLSDLKVPLNGYVASDITIRGSKFRSESNTLDVGMIKSSEGAKYNLYMIVRGPYRENVKMNITKISPADILRATIGKRRKLGGGNSIRYPLTIEIPPGSRAVNHVRDGKSKPAFIEIETTHPTAKKINLRIYFATDGSKS